MAQTSDYNDQLQRIEDALANVDADLAAHESARASMQATLVAEHDATQAALAAARSSIEGLITNLDGDVDAARIALLAALAELDADVGEDTDPTSVETVQARLKRIEANQDNEAITYERLSG